MSGTADYKECKVPGFCPEHKEHDVEPYMLAERLHKKHYGENASYNQSKYINDYYSVRPTLY